MDKVLNAALQILIQSGESIVTGKVKFVEFLANKSFN